MKRVRFILRQIALASLGFLVVAAPIAFVNLLKAGKTEAAWPALSIPVLSVVEGLALSEVEGLALIRQLTEKGTTTTGGLYEEARNGPTFSLY